MAGFGAGSITTCTSRFASSRPSGTWTFSTPSAPTVDRRTIRVMVTSSWSHSTSFPGLDSVVVLSRRKGQHPAVVQGDDGTAGAVHGQAPQHGGGGQPVFPQYLAILQAQGNQRGGLHVAFLDRIVRAGHQQDV